jgi:hypothetical protein
MLKLLSQTKYYKQHHILIFKISLISTFTDSMIEFLLMDLFAKIAAIFIVGELPFFNVVLLSIYFAITRSLNHSDFCLDKFWFNSIYHYTHLAEPALNYSELTYINIIVGTYKMYPLD